MNLVFILLNHSNYYLEMAFYPCRVRTWYSLSPKYHFWNCISALSLLQARGNKEYPLMSLQITNFWWVVELCRNRLFWAARFPWLGCFWFWCPYGGYSYHCANSEDLDRFDIAIWEAVIGGSWFCRIFVWCRLRGHLW